MRHLPGASRINCGCYGFLGEGWAADCVNSAKCEACSFSPSDILNFGILNRGRGYFERKETCSSKNSVNDKILQGEDEQCRVGTIPLPQCWMASRSTHLMALLSYSHRFSGPHVIAQSHVSLERCCDSSCALSLSVFHLL